MRVCVAAWVVVCACRGGPDSGILCIYMTAGAGGGRGGGEQERPESADQADAHNADVERMPPWHWMA